MNIEQGMLDVKMWETSAFDNQLSGMNNQNRVIVSFRLIVTKSK